MSERVFVTSEGRQVRIKAIAWNRIVDEIKALARRQAIAAGESIEPPCYIATTVAGVEERHPHDATTLETDEDKAAWAEHQAALARLQETANTRIGRYIIRKGIEGCDPPEGWAKEQAAFGIEIDPDPAEAYYQYIDLEVLPTSADVNGLLTAVYDLSLEGVDRERRALLVDLFRCALEGHAPEPGQTEGRGVDI